MLIGSRHNGSLIGSSCLQPIFLGRNGVLSARNTVEFLSAPSERFALSEALPSASLFIEPEFSLAVPLASDERRRKGSKYEDTPVSGNENLRGNRTAVGTIGASLRTLLEYYIHDKGKSGSIQIVNEPIVSRSITFRRPSLAARSAPKLFSCQKGRFYRNREIHCFLSSSLPRMFHGNHRFIYKMPRGRRSEKRAVRVSKSRRHASV